MEPLKQDPTLPPCPRCNHKHQLTPPNYTTEKCPYCKCKMQYNKTTKKYEPNPKQLQYI